MQKTVLKPQTDLQLLHESMALIHLWASPWFSPVHLQLQGTSSPLASQRPPQIVHMLFSFLICYITDSIQEVDNNTNPHHEVLTFMLSLSCWGNKSHTYPHGLQHGHNGLTIRHVPCLNIVNGIDYKQWHCPGCVTICCYHELRRTT